MSKICDHKAVGMLVWQDKKLLLIERKNPPFGFAPPAGHVDQDNSYKIATKRELKEEVGLEAKNIKLLIAGYKNNPCRRIGRTWHYWKIYQIEAFGKIKRCQYETKQAGFYDRKDLLKLSKKTEKYLKGNIKQSEWEKSPGLEPVWYKWLKELKII